MFKKFIMTFAVLAVGIATAETYRVTLFQPSVVKGTELKAGEYRVTVADQKATLVNGKNSVEVSVKVESADQKFASTTVRYTQQGEKYTIAEIRLGGTKTKLVFNQ